MALPRVHLWGSSSASGPPLPAALASVTGREVVAAGRPSARMRTADPKWIAREAEEVWIYLGANDGTGDYNNGDVAEVDRAVRAWTSAKRVVWLPLPAYPDPHRLSVANVHGIHVGASGVTHAGIGPVELSKGALRDGVHFSVAGAAEYARTVGPHLRAASSPTLAPILAGAALLGGLLWAAKHRAG